MSVYGLFNCKNSSKSNFNGWTITYELHNVIATDI